MNEQCVEAKRFLMYLKAEAKLCMLSVPGQQPQEPVWDQAGRAGRAVASWKILFGGGGGGTYPCVKRQTLLFFKGTEKWVTRVWME